MNRLISHPPTLTAVLLAALATSCITLYTPEKSERAIEWVDVALEVTAYSSDQKSTGWKYNKDGVPVFTSGPNKGKPKIIGQTASGVMARKGTIAADTSRYPFGTWIFVPGYGYGRVEDRGSAIKGNRLDLYFPHHADAVKWGRQRIVCRVLVSHNIRLIDRKMKYAERKKRTPQTPKKSVRRKRE